MGRVNESTLEWETVDRGDSHFRRKRLAAAAGGDQLGCSLYELPSDGRSWPYHYHEANEEAIYVLAGSGTLRHDGEQRGVVAGDFVALPTGAASAHQLHNDGDDPLRYLAVSTMVDPDVMVYPDSGKVGVVAGAPPGGEGERSLEAYFPREASVDYWDGE